MAIGTITISFYKQIDIVTNIALVFWILIIFVIFFIHLLKIWVQLNQNKRVNIFLLDSPIIFFGLNGILNTLFSLNLNEFSLIPEFFLGFSSLMVSIYFSLVAYNKRYSFHLIQKILMSLSFLFFLLTFILIINDSILTTSKHISLNNVSFCSFLSLLSKILLILVSCLCLFAISTYIIKENRLNNSEYFLLFIYTILGLMLLISTNDLLSLFLTIEIQGLSLYTISALKKLRSILLIVVLNTLF